MKTVVLDNGIVGIVDPVDVAGSIALRVTSYPCEIHCSKLLYERLKKDYFRGYLGARSTYVFGLPKWVLMIRRVFPKFGKRFEKKVSDFSPSPQLVEALTAEYLGNYRIPINGVTYPLKVL